MNNTEVIRAPPDTIVRPQCPLWVISGPKADIRGYGWNVHFASITQRSRQLSAVKVSHELPELPFGFRKHCLDDAADPQFLGFFKKLVGSPHKHSLRRRINRHSRPRIEIVRHLPKFLYGRHASF